MKISKIVAFTIAGAIAFSCSKDDEAQPDLEKASLSLSGSQQVVVVPTAMATNQDQHAQMATSWISLANGLSANMALFTPPAGATKSTEVITPVNGRVNAGNSVVYTWSDPQFGTVAYQITDASSKFTFELFYKETSGTEWYRYLYAEENKDKSEGFMEVYDLTSDTADALMRWDWARSGDNFTFEFSSFTDFHMILEVNTKTSAGTLTYFEGTDKLYEMTWDAQGKGSWKQFSGDSIIDEGTW